MPLVITYFNEFIQEKRRRLATTVLFLWWPIGAAYVVMISWFILPSTGFHLNEELKEHFSAWRRLLLAAWAPSLLSLIAFIFMPEAPLNLLQNGRDAESLSIYKVINLTLHISSFNEKINMVIFQNSNSTNATRVAKRRSVFLKSRFPRRCQ